MRLILQIFPLLLAGLIPAMAQPSAPAHAPRLFCAQPVHAFGEVSNATNVEHTFVLENRGDLSLELIDIRTSCGCTLAKVSRRVIPPGESALLEARLALQGRQGPQHKPIYIHSNDPQSPDLTLMLEGVAKADLAMAPDLVFFLNAERGKASVQTVVVTYSGREPFAIAGLEYDPIPGLETRLETVAPGREYRITVTLTPTPKTPERVISNLRIKTEPDRPLFILPVRALVQK